MSDRTELELALSVAEEAAKGILEEWEDLDKDGKEDPSNKIVHELATQTLAVVNEYRNNLNKIVHYLEQEIDRYVAPRLSAKEYEGARESQQRYRERYRHEQGH